MPPIRLSRLLAPAVGVIVFLALALWPVASGAAATPSSEVGDPGFRAYPADGLIGEQWWLAEIVDTDALELPTVRPSSPRLAIVAPGIYRNHPDLQGIDIEGTESRGLEKDLFGTAAAGIAASPGGVSGIVGVWPGMNLRQAPSGDGTCIEASEAVRKAADMGSDVILMGYAFRRETCRAHLAATQYAVHKGAVLVASAGDGAAGAGPTALRPASDPHVIAVGSVDRRLSPSPPFDIGPEIDLVAPGESILAPWLESSDSTTPRPIHQPVSGTRYAATMVAAAASLILQARTGIDRSQIAAVLAAGARDLGAPGRDQVFGSGLLDIDAALAAEAPVADRMEPNDDIGWVNGRFLTEGRKRLKAKPISPKPGGGDRRLQATLSSDDPADVYRVRIPARSRAVIAVAQAEGDVAIKVLSGASRAITASKGRLAVSDRPPPATEGIVVRNRARDVRLVYLVVEPGRLSGSPEARYRLTVGDSIPG